MDEIIQATLNALDNFAKAKKEKALQQRDKVLEEQKFLRQRASGGKK